MKNIHHINQDELFRKLNIKYIDLIKKGFFSTDDFDGYGNVDFGTTLFLKIKKTIKYLSFSVNNPNFFRYFIVPAITNSVLGKFMSNGNTINPIFFRQYNLRASIIASMKPRNMLEIGTYLGWGAACFKFVMPKCRVYTMNPEYDNDSNNPIDKHSIGIVCKKKGLKIQQIWADSTKYDYSNLPSIDVAYIDGNHDYDFVLSDLENVYKIGVKNILIDDYIPNNYTKYKLVYAPWNDSVVQATNKFIKRRGYYYNSYYIEGTNLALLIRKKYSHSDLR